LVFDMLNKLMNNDRMAENVGLKDEKLVVPQNPIVKVVDAAKIVDDKGNLIFDEFSFIQPDTTHNEHFMLALPNVSASDLDALKRNLRRDADGANLDLHVSIYGSLEESQDKETDSWEIGWDDGSRVWLNIYPKEFFQIPGAKQAFENQIVPKFVDSYSE
jgi:hypothetical protein